jgi:hypothetical protein
LHGNSRLDGATFGYDYPSAQNGDWIKHFSFFLYFQKLGNDSELGLSLGRKVGRPNFRHLFVGIQANDKQNITVGNRKYNLSLSILRNFLITPLGDICRG